MNTCAYLCSTHSYDFRRQTSGPIVSPTNAIERSLGSQLPTADCAVATQHCYIDLHTPRRSTMSLSLPRRVGLIGVATVAFVATLSASTSAYAASQGDLGAFHATSHRVMMPPKNPKAAAAAARTSALRYGGGVDGIGVTTGSPKV